MAVSLGGQAKVAVASNTVATSAAWGTQPTAGSAIVVGVVFTNDTSQTVSSVTDNASNTYTAVAAKLASSGNNNYVQFWETKNAATAASFTFTITMSATTTYITGYGLEIKGAHLTEGAEIKGGQAQGSTAAGTDVLTTGAVGTTTVDGEFVVGLSVVNGGTDSWAAGTGYTLIDSHRTTIHSMAEYKVQASQGSITAVFTFAGASQTSGNILATYKAAAAQSVVPVVLAQFRERR